MPYLAYTNPRPSDESGYYVGLTFDEVVEWAQLFGCAAEELRERLEEAIEKAAEQ